MRMRKPAFITNVLIGTAAVVMGAGIVTHKDESASAPRRPAVEYLSSVITPDSAMAAEVPASAPAAKVRSALAALAASVTRMSHPQALESAFRSYYAYQAEHPEKVKNPYFYFVDYGLPSATPRGYVFDMKTLKVVDGPFTVAHGRGSKANSAGIPTRFSNAPGSAATSLGLYLAQETYGFSGKASGRFYTSIGLRLAGLSGDWNDNARARGVVAHGAPYVASNRAGRSEGCPAMEQFRAKQLLPKLANGGLVFLFAPRDEWIRSDPWIALADSTNGTHS